MLSSWIFFLVCAVSLLESNGGINPCPFHFCSIYLISFFSFAPHQKIDIVLYLTFLVVSLQKSGDGSMALTIAAVWTGLIHLALGVLGTFVLKRFPTSFSVGFFLGVLVVLANQNIILYASFHKYTQGSGKANQVFASLGFLLFAVLTFMSLLLVQFKNDVVIAPMDSIGGEDNENPSLTAA